MKKFNILFMAIAMILSINQTLIAQENQQSAPKIYNGPTDYFGFSGYLQGAGREGKLFKGEQFVQSETAKYIFESLYFHGTYGLENQDDPAIIAHWASKGLTKEVYDIDDADRMWSVFTPNGIYQSYDEGHKFPLVFCLHGNDNEILLAETYGFAELGGEEGFITVIPWAKNEDIILEEIPRILDILREKNYPIDESRIYATGFSKGGMATMRAGMNFPEMLAAIAPGGAGPASVVGENDEALNAVGPSLGFTAEQYANAAKYTLPVLFFGGTCDNMPINSNAKNWIGITGAVAPEITDETVANTTANSGYGVERMTGLNYDLDGMEIRALDGTYYYIGSYFNEDGICTFRTVAVEGAPHWLIRSESAVVWEFLSQFSRDRSTGKLLYSK